MELTSIHAIILGIVEGLTEFLPVSSTAHLLITGAFLHIPPTDFVKSFDIAIQLGAILAVVVFALPKLGTYIRQWKIYVAAFIPTALVGFFLYPFIKGTLLETPIVIPIALFVGGVLMLVLDREESEDARTTISLKQALWIGVAQSLAVIPGVSRSASVIMGGQVQNIRRVAIVEFSFILAIPVMVASTGYDLMKTGFSFTGHEYMLLGIGMLSAFIVALGVIKLFLAYVRKAQFSVFAWYRIALAIVFFVFLISK